MARLADVPATDRSIVLVGFMGAGKTTAARTIGRILGLDARDTDELIVADAGRPIATLFAEQGEAGFRKLEERVVLAALDAPGVIALGGGAVESERVRDALAEPLVVWLDVDEQLAWARCAGSDRPLARDRDGFRRRFRARRPLYAEIADAVLPGNREDLAEIAAPWLGAVASEPETKLAWGSSESGQYPVIVGPGSSRIFDREAETPRPGARHFAIADEAALEAVPHLLPGVEGDPLVVAGGERSKTMAVASELLPRLARAGVRRDDALVAFGGGVVGDLAGFCAAVYQRGVPVVQVPTTLVAQVDSSIGGKTGVDLPEAKNYVGAFHQPSAVLADPAALATLPPEEIAAGFAEVVKTALIAGGPLWERVRSLDRFDAEALGPLVFDCALTKLEVVAADERDGGRRAVLNLGHTVGHAIEVATGYGRYRHGEAVGLGLLAALRLSDARDLRDEVADLLDSGGLPTSLAGDVVVDDVLDATGRDKKRTAAGVGFVLVRSPGDVVHGQAVDADSLRAAVEELIE